MFPEFVYLSKMEWLTYQVQYQAYRSLGPVAPLAHAYAIQVTYQLITVPTIKKENLTSLKYFITIEDSNKEKNYQFIYFIKTDKNKFGDTRSVGPK